MLTVQVNTRLLYIPADMDLIFVTSGILSGLVTLYFFLNQKVKPFNVDVKPLEMEEMGVNIFPLFIFFMRLMPDRMRKKMMTKQV